MSLISFFTSFSPPFVLPFLPNVCVGGTLAIMDKSGLRKWKSPLPLPHYHQRDALKQGTLPQLLPWSCSVTIRSDYGCTGQLQVWMCVTVWVLSGRSCIREPGSETSINMDLFTQQWKQTLFFFRLSTSLGYLSAVFIWLQDILMP